MPGDNVVMDVELITPIAIEEGLRFAIPVSYTHLDVYKRQGKSGSAC